MKYLVIITNKTQDYTKFEMSPEDYANIDEQLRVGSNLLIIRAKTGGSYSRFMYPIENLLYIQCMEQDGECSEIKLIS